MSTAVTSHLAMADGTKLFVRDWLINEVGDTSPQPCIVLLHGLGEHCGRYDHVVAFLNECGFSVRTFDHRGHGQSSGARGDVPDTLTIVADAQAVITDFTQRCQTVPLLFGHSMGGLYAARIATEAAIPLRGLILSSPALALRLSWIEHGLLKVMSAIAPHFAIPSGLKPVYLSHKLDVVVAYVNDPLVHDKITASLLNSMLDAIDYTLTNAPLLTIPTLLMVAEGDELINPKGSHDFFEVLPSNICTAHFYSYYYHEIFNEIGAEKVFDDLQNWLTARQFVSQ